MRKKSFIEKTAEALHLIQTIAPERDEALPRLQVRSLRGFPPPERWQDWEEYEPGAWPFRQVAPPSSERQIMQRS